MRKNYLRSQHSLDIFPGQEAEGGSLFLVTFLFLQRNKKVKLDYKLIGGYYYMCWIDSDKWNKFTRQ